MAETLACPPAGGDLNPAKMLTLFANTLNGFDGVELFLAALTGIFS